MSTEQELKDRIDVHDEAMADLVSPAPNNEPEDKPKTRREQRDERKAT